MTNNYAIKLINHIIIFTVIILHNSSVRSIRPGIEGLFLVIS